MDGEPQPTCLGPRLAPSAHFILSPFVVVGEGVGGAEEIGTG